MAELTLLTGSLRAVLRAGLRCRRFMAQACVGVVLAGSTVACDVGVQLDPALADAPLPAPDDPIDDEVADAGAWLFQRNCSACHHIGDTSLIGPDLAGVTTRRSAEWITAMIRNPDSMLVTDSIAQRLHAQYQVPMANRRLDGARVRALLEFLRRADRGEEAEGEASLPEVTEGITPSGIAWSRAGEGPTVVLVHGTNLDRAVWDPIRERLTEAHSVVDYDLRSHGDSRDATGPWSDVGDLDDVLAATGVSTTEAATIVGLSAGAGIALEFALARPSRVGRLVLVSPSVRGFTPQPGDVPDVFGPLMTALRGDDTSSIGDAMVALPTFDVNLDDRQLVDAMVRRNLRLFRVDPSWAMSPSTAPLGRLGEIDAPTIALVGSADFVATRRLAEQLVRNLPQGRLTLVEGGRHLLPITDPNAVTDAILGVER